jgi:23S rRNA pseudouridine2605 synthase
VKERVQKLMAQANLGSRRACEDIIQQGRVRVNGQVIHLGDQADPQTDVVEVDGEKLAFPDRKTYIAFHKPKNVLSTDDPNSEDWRRTVRSYVPYEGHLFNIGRLDADSEGLMVLTNDGELANRLTHPRYRHTKTYKVVVHGLPSEATIQQWEKGVVIEEEDGSTYKTAPCSVKITDGDKIETTLRIVMTEGKKRQIRRVAVQLGHPVKSLVRTHIGKLALGTLRVGEWRELNAKDVNALKTPADEIIPRGRASRPHPPSRYPAKPGVSSGKSTGSQHKRTNKRRKI